jgi:hypothetical protein
MHIFLLGLGSVFWTLSIALMFFKLLRFKGRFFPRPQVKPTLLGPVIELASIIGPSAPSSKTFRDEFLSGVVIHTNMYAI